METLKEAKKGRPTLYKKKYCSQIIEYFKVSPLVTDPKRTFYPDGTIKSEDPQVRGAEFPTFQGFASSLGVHVSTLLDWRDLHEDFAFSYALAKQLQENIWLVNSISGLYNSQFARFFGKCCLGYTDKSENETSSDVSIHLDDEIEEWAR
ncbi:MAG: terminase small subunit [Oscillospiraceae bacterium]